MNDFIRQQISSLGEAVVTLGHCIRSPCSNTAAKYENDVFVLRAYSWGDCAIADAKDEPDPVCNDDSCDICAPNFVFKDSSFSASWYKHVNRGFTCEKVESSQQAIKMFAECLQSLANCGRKVYIDSHSHYQLKQDGDKLLLLEYGTGDPDDESYDMCPGLEQRGPFQPDEGRIIEEFTEGEEVEFIYSSFDSKITVSKAGEKIRCGDDLKYHFGKLMTDIPKD